MDNRQAKIKQLSRANRERASRPAFLKGLLDAIGIEVGVEALIAPSKADELMSAYRRGYADAIKFDGMAYRRFWGSHQEAPVLRLASCLGDRLASEQVYFLTKFGGDCRAVLLGASDLLKEAASIIALDGDSLSLLSRDCIQGLLIDYNPDDSEQAYEFAVWGDRWPMVALACDQRSVHP